MMQSKKDQLHLLLNSRPPITIDHIKRNLVSFLLKADDWELKSFGEAVTESSICGHVFSRGEQVYRCKTCALDDTCVLCVDCFKASDHTGHDTGFSISEGMSGFCDCGDKEAWKVDIFCRIHSDLKMSQEINMPSKVEDHLRLCFGMVLDFVLNVFESSPLDVTLPTPAEVLAMVEKQITTQIEFIGYLWNDESHSFQEVIDQLVDGIGCSDSQGKIIAEEVDEKGRAEFSRSNDIHSLIDAARVVAETGLAVSISTDERAFQEELAAELLAWLVQDIPKLFSSKFKLTLASKTLEWNSLDVFVRKLLETELSCDRQGFKNQFQDVEPLADVFMIKNISAVTRDPIPDFSYSSLYTSRLHYLLDFDTKLWKIPRSNLRQLLINCYITLDDYSKKKLGLYFAYHYPELMNYTMFHDRENDLSITYFTVQLFTVPTIAEFLVKHTKMISSIFFILKGFFLGDSIPEDFRPQYDLLGSYQLASTMNKSIFPRMTCESGIVRNRKYWHLFQDVRYVLSTDLVKKKLFRKYSEHMQDFLDLLIIFQGMQPQQRSTQVHVEYETDHWVYALNLALLLSNMIGQVGDCFGYSDENYDECYLDLTEAIKKTVFTLATWCAIDHVKETLQNNNKSTGNSSASLDFPFGFHQINFGCKTFTLPDFKVSLHRVSLYDPLHCLLAELISKLPHVLEHTSNLKDGETVWKSAFSKENMEKFILEDNVSSYSKHLESLTAGNLAILLFDYPMRIIVMLSQIRAGIWVRNGYMMRSQAQHFREVMLRECYDSNLLLIQTAASILPPSIFLAILVERFELKTWLDFGKAANIDLAQQASINEDMLEVLIYILSERSKILGLSHVQNLKQEIIHHLGSSNGLAYSELKKHIPDRLLETSQDLEAFDNLLSEVSIFKFPENPLDQGVYLLKIDYFAQLDPWFWHLSKLERNSLVAILKKKTDEALNRGGEELNLPFLMPISSRSFHKQLISLFNDEIFIQIIFYSIWNSTKTLEISGEESTSSDHVISASIQLILLGISESKNPPDSFSLDAFYRNFSSAQFKITISGAVRPTTCLELICFLIDRANEEDIKDHARKLRFIISQMELYGVDLAIQTITGWRDKSRWTLSSHKKSEAPTGDHDGDKLTERERKKIAAKKRQAAIMAQFESAQKSFMANYGEELDYLDDGSAMEISSENFSTPPERTPDQRVVPFPSGPCIVCQEDASIGDGRIYGSLGLIQTSFLERRFQFGENSPFLQSISHNSGFDLSKAGSIQNPETGKGIYSSSCGHLMHNSCFNTYIQSIESRQNSQSTRNHPEDISRREFLCPLCKTFGNVLFPITASSYSQFVNWFGSESISESNVQKDHENSSESLSRWWMLKGDKIQEIVSGGMLITPRTFPVETKDFQPTKEVVESRINTFKDYINNIFMLQRSVVGGRSSWSHSEELERAFDDNWIPAVEHACDELDLSLLGIEPNYLLSYTICCIEIASRGIKADLPTGSIGANIDIINCLNPQIATFLPVFVSALQSYSRICLQETEFCSVLNRESSDLFTALFSGILKDIHTVAVPGILNRDPFQVLTQIVQIVDLLSEASISDLFGWIRICWLLEITRISSSIILNGSIGANGGNRINLESMLITDIYSSLKLSDSNCLTESDLDILVSICESMGLIFLRRTVLLCFAFFGMVPPNGRYGFGFESNALETVSDSNSTEFSTLLSYLSLPNVRDILCTRTNDSSIEKILISNWIENSRYQLKFNYFSVPSLFKLVDLPHTYDELFEVGRKYLCPNCNQKPSDPALCLVCGTIVCSQSYCCLKNGLGECNQHSKKCTGPIGIFLLVKKCVVLLLHAQKGFFHNSPYLDAHGESDLGLKRGKPLFLNDGRYNELVKLWINHQICSFIARKIESSFDFGGWNTL